VVTDHGRRELAEAFILDGADGLIAFGVHGETEGWVGLVDPTTEIWTST